MTQYDTINRQVITPYEIHTPLWNILEMFSIEEECEFLTNYLIRSREGVTLYFGCVTMHISKGSESVPM